MTAPSRHARRLLHRYGARLLAAERSGACAADPMAALQAMAEAQREVGEYVGALEADRALLDWLEEYSHEHGEIAFVPVGEDVGIALLSRVTVHRDALDPAGVAGTVRGAISQAITRVLARSAGAA